MDREIKDRNDVSELVHAFYEKIRSDELLGHIFNDTIDEWPVHLEKLTDFWESILLGANNFKGRPMRAHFMVDAKYNHSLSELHFEAWLSLWFETVDEIFSGKLAEMAKEKARNIAQVTFIRLHQARMNQGLL